MNKYPRNSRVYREPEKKEPQKQPPVTPHENRIHETPWRKEQKSDISDYDDE